MLVFEKFDDLCVLTNNSTTVTFQNYLAILRKYSKSVISVLFLIN